jgi:starch-binding outer membrane protein, SusD/RagB family
MKKNILYIKLFSLLLLLTTITSCEKKLEEVAPPTALNRNLVLQDANAARTLYHGIYATYRSYHTLFFLLGEMRSEIWADGFFTESQDAGLFNLYTHNISANVVPAPNWGALYGLIYRINTVIDLFPNAPLPDAERNRILAEMHGLRAYIYYVMLKTWGGVPLTTEPLVQVGSLADLYKERAPASAILSQVKEDINQSLTLFEGNNAFTPKRVYWNRVATLTLKGDVFIWSATHENGGVQDLNVARQALEEIVALEGNTLGLQDNYADIFDPTKKVNNKEIIFAINYEQNEANNTAYELFRVNVTAATSLVFNPGTPNQQTVSAAYPFVTGGNRVGFSTAMLNKLNDSADSRRLYTFRIMHRNTPPAYPAAGVMLTKFIGRVIAGMQVYDTDFPIYRYADVLLLLAEVKAKLNLDPSVEINKIRRRAYGPSFTPYVNGTVTENIEAILEEDLREFIGEGRRWWSLRRAGNEWVYKYIRPQYLSAATQHKLLLPITLATLNSDPKLTQTPGY